MIEQDTELPPDIAEYLPLGLSLEICICLIQDMFDQLTILKTINKWPEVKIVDFIQSIEIRFKNPVIQDEEFQNNIPKQCSFLVTLLENLLEEMKNHGSHAAFLNHVKTLLQMKSYEEYILQQAEENQCEVKKAQKALEDEKSSYVNKIIKCITDIGQIKDKIENFQIESEIKLNFIKSWQNAKMEMDETIFLKTFEDTKEKINTTQFNIASEMRVHQNQEMALSEFQEELTEMVDLWKNKYAETLAKMNKKIHDLQEQQNQQLHCIAQLKEVYAKRQQEISDWNEYVIEQEKLRAEKERRNKAAIKIQAWWRGTMVRKGYGKFRKKKEKKTKKNSEKTPPKKSMKK